MTSNFFKIVILGAPGSGKGTISKRIVRDFGLKYLSSGDLLRSQIAEKTDAGQQAKSYLNNGQLVPDSLMVKLFLDELAKINGNSWLLDGFPRTASQAKALEESEKVDLAINLDVPFKVIIDRIKGRWTHLPSGRIYHEEFNPPKNLGIDDITGEKLVQRDDDQPEVVRKRLETYSKNMAEVLDFYRNKQLLKEFQGVESNVIWPEVRKFLETYLQPLENHRSIR